MTLFEGMCLGFTAGVIMTIIAIMIGFILDKGGKDEVQDTKGNE